jgi:hypothetical protein
MRPMRRPVCCAGVALTVVCVPEKSPHPVRWAQHTQSQLRGRIHQSDEMGRTRKSDPEVFSAAQSSGL